MYLSIRFPFISSEVLTCEIDVILKTLVEEEEVLYYFSSFLCYDGYKNLSFSLLNLGLMFLFLWSHLIVSLY